MANKSRIYKEIGDKVSEYKVFSEKQIRDFQDFFHKNINLFDINIEPCLVHGDLWEPNVIVKKDGESFRIAAIIDAYSDKVQFDNNVDFLNSQKWALEFLEQVKSI